MRKFLPFIVAPAFCCAFPALANDTMAELKTGGLVFVRSDVVAIEKEDLYISLDEVRVSYRFRNTSDEDVETVVAFPMPELVGDPYSEVAVPDSQSDNLLDFSVEVDGKPVEPPLEQKAFAVGLDVTAALVAAQVPLNPYAEAVNEAIERLPDATKSDWVARGILQREAWDDGSGMKEHHVPIWSMTSTYWWRMNFPGGEAVEVRHRYQPSVGGTVGVAFMEDGKAKGETYESYRTRYCVDDSFARAVERHAAQNPDGYAPFYENWISYVLTTGGNWAGPIGEFRLTIDKGAAENLISFCGQNVRKVGPTTFEMTATDFYPRSDLDILVLKRMNFSDDRDGASAAQRSTERKALMPQ